MKKKFEINKKIVNECAKGAVSYCVSASIGFVLANAMKQLSPSDISLVQKGISGVGTFFIAHVVSEKASEYAEDKYDSVIETIKNAKVITTAEETNGEG